MADFIKGLFERGRPAPSAADSDFADFAGAPEPSPAIVSAYTASAASSQPAFATAAPGITYTAWYRIWERTSPSDFKQEAMIVPVILIIAALHLWGRRKNRNIARNWAVAHAPTLEKEFSVVGFNGRRALTVEDVQADGLLKSSLAQPPVEYLKEKTGQEFTTYASGRQNTAFLDVKLTLLKRYNPLTYLIELVLSLLFQSFKAPVEHMEAVAYAFDGREKDIVPVATQQEQGELEAKTKGLQSTYDGFVWAVVHKDVMRELRDDRYDVSLTYTKDHDKLPAWATVMSESAEITNFMLTQDLAKAVEQAGEEVFEHLIVSDQPLEKPTKLNETIPRKRVSLALRIPSGSGSPAAYMPSLHLFSYFLRIPDTLAQTAHFRPEVLRKVRSTRDDEIRKLKRADEDEKAEERKVETDKKKKADRDAKLNAMKPAEQKKFLEKERDKEARKQGKKQQMKG